MTPNQIIGRAFTMVRNVVNTDSATAARDNTVLCTVKRMDDRINHFGATPHVAVQYQDETGDYHYGWIPLHVWDSIVGPMVRRHI